MKEKLRQRTKRKRASTSLFFWVWGIISILCLLLLLLFGISQRVVLGQTVRQHAVQDVTVRGQTVKEQIIKPLPPSFADYDEYAKHLSSTYEVSVAVIDENGQALCTSGEERNFSAKMQTIKGKLTAGEALHGSNKFTIFQDGDDCVYVCLLDEGAQQRYLYVAKDVSFIGDAVNEMGTRTVFTAIFAFVLSFSVAAAISAAFTKPIGEMKDKAKYLARGDFSVDFHGSDYGKEMTELADSLNFARDELSKTDKMQKELIANVSHDFKTPLTMIKAYASMIVEISGEDREKRNRHAKVIEAEADRLTSLVNDLLDLSKLQSGIARLSEETFDLSAYTEQTVEKFEYLRESQGYDIHTEIEKGIILFADKGKIGQVLHNLVGNAVNYTGADKKVYVRLQRMEDKARFSVTDTGNGIAQEEIAEIWDRYYRSESAHKRPVQGTGLGLSIVRKVLQMHGFAFGVESEIGKGSTFYVDFPCNQPEKKH